MTSDHDHICMVGRYGQGQHTQVTSRSQGQSQGHQGRFRFWPILRIFANSSYSSHRRGLEMPRNVPCGHTKKRNAAEFSIFALKVRYCPYKVKHQNRHLTALMTSDHDHIRMVGRYGQGQHTHVTSRSKSRSPKLFPFSRFFRTFLQTHP